MELRRVESAETSWRSRSAMSIPRCWTFCPADESIWPLCPVHTVVSLQLGYLVIPPHLLSCIATTRSVTSRLASFAAFAHCSPRALSNRPAARGLPEAFAARGEAYTEMQGHCKAVARRQVGGRDLARAGKNLLALPHGYRRERFPHRRIRHCEVRAGLTAARHSLARSTNQPVRCTARQSAFEKSLTTVA